MMTWQWKSSSIIFKHPAEDFGSEEVVFQLSIVDACKDLAVEDIFKLSVEDTFKDLAVEVFFKLSVEDLRSDPAEEVIFNHL